MPQDRARPLGQASLIALGLNGVIGVGIFFIPSSVAAHVPGTGGAFVYLLTALACLPIALSFGRLAPRFAEDGGPYVYARAAFGPWAAYVTGWLTYVSAVLSTSAVIRGLAEASIPGGRLMSLPDPTRVTASATVIGLALLTAAGLRVTAWAWSAITVAKLVPLLMLLGAWMVRGAPEAPASTPQIPHPCPELSALLRAGLLVLFSLQGFEIVPVPAGHVQQPKAMPRATVAALVIAAMFYCALQMACVQALPGLSASQAPLVDAANVYGGPGLARVLTLGTSVSALGIALGMVAMTPRYLATLGRSDGLGSWMGACSAKGVPLRALGLTAVVTLVLVQLGSLDELFALSSIAVLAQYAATALSLVVLGARGERGLGRRDILLGVVAMVAALSVVAGASWRELVRAVAVIALGVVVKIGVACGARHRPG